MKIAGPQVRNGLFRALEWLDKRLIQAESSIEANELCDNFEQSARRVPRNICNDPAVEAKRALSGSLKDGLLAIKKSMLNCLNEADDAFLLVFGDSLSCSAAEYFELDLKFGLAADESSKQMQVTLKSKRDRLTIILKAWRSLDRKDAQVSAVCIVPAAPGAIRAASDEDLSCLIADRN